MMTNKLTIRIKKPVNEVFTFTITPPNSTLWIDSVIHEKTNEWPIRVGTIYRLKNTKGEISEVVVTALKENQLVEWVSKDQNYHVRYTYKSIDKKTCELEYFEWVDTGQLDQPFTQETLEKLKLVLDS